MRFKSFMEANEYPAAFLKGHFEQPFDDATMLIWADWLEENGDPHMGELLRLAIGGHDERGGRAYHDTVQQLFRAINERLRGKVHFINDHMFDFGKRKRYMVRFDKIEALNTKTGFYDELPRRKWTPEIIEAATYLILRRLTVTPDKLYRDDDETWFRRPNNLVVKQLYQAMVQFAKTLNHTIVAETSPGLGERGIRAWVIRPVEHLIAVLRTMRKSNLSHSDPSIARAARGCRHLMEELDNLMTRHGMTPIGMDARVGLLAAELSRIIG